jgi:hypothetical protein
MQIGEKEESSPAAKLIVHGAFVEGDLDITKQRARRVHEWYFDPRLPAAKLGLTMAPPESGTIAVLAEKPSVARDIAHVLGATSRGDGYLHGNGYVVAWAIGR